jgi:hypothetical protein
MQLNRTVPALKAVKNSRRSSMPASSNQRPKSPRKAGQSLWLLENKPLMQRITLKIHVAGREAAVLRSQKGLIREAIAP